MNTYSQTPPTPIAKSGITHGNITYSLAETTNTFAFSCSFKSDKNQKILALIKEEFHDFNKSLFFKIDNNFEYSIELETSELKIEFKSYNNHDSHEIEKLKLISDKILRL